MKILCFEGKRIVEKEFEVEKITDNIYINKDYVFWYYPEIDMGIIIETNRSYYTKMNYTNFENKMKKIKKDTIKNYIETLDNKFKNGKYISGVEIQLVSSKVSAEKLKKYKSTKKTQCAVTVNTQKMRDIVERENSLVQKTVNEAIEKFKNKEYLENVTLKIYSEGTSDVKIKEISLVSYMADTLGVYVMPRVKGWINKNLKACWGNAQVKCDAQSTKIFEVLNSIMSKLNES